MDRLQSHFDKHPIEFLARGSQMAVYGTEQLVLKVIDPNSRLRELGEGRTREMIKSAHQKGLACLGDLAVPYALPEKVMAHTVEESGWWLFKNRRKVEKRFAEPIVQEKATGTLASSLLNAASRSDAAEFADLIDSLILLRERLVGVGAFPYDPIPDNYVLHQGNMVVRDIGSLVLSKSMVKRALSNTPIMRNMATRNLFPYEAKAAHLAGNPKVAKALQAFRQHLDWTYSNEVRADLGKNRDKKPLAFVHFDV